MHDYLKYRLWLTIAFSPGNRRINKLIEKYGSPEAVFDSFQNGDTLGLPQSELGNLKSVTSRQVEHLYESCMEKGIDIIAPEDEDYPQKLNGLDNQPNILFSYGNLSQTKTQPSIAVIGARDADEYAINATRRLTYELALKGITIISGFAKGIDTYAHRAALSAGSNTVAVLGCGIDYDYPHNTRKFKDEISKSGAVISEYFPSANPVPMNFKVRNRIIAGLADGILVIQAGEHSGTLNTVSHALSQGKDIFVLPPHDIFNDSYKGNIGLLRDGATPVYAVQDILAQL